MENDLLKMSLIQGKEFNKYQTKIKKYANKTRIKEGFVSAEQEMMLRPEDKGYISVLKNQQNATELTNKSNKEDLEDFKNLQAKYSDLLVKYINMQTSIGNKSLSHINRVSSNNPYLNKNIRFTDGTLCYVTNHGIAKQYPNMNVYNGIVGKNGCPPKEYISLDMSWSSDYVKGSTIPTNPPLIIGTNMVGGQSCGYEGDNIYASKLTNNPNSSYVGCYNNASKHSESAMFLNTNGYTTFDKCQEYALNGGYQYFGMQDVQSDGTASCLVSNDITEIQMYGDGTNQATSISLWSSNTLTGHPNKAQLVGTGQITITDSSDKVVSNINKVVSGCENGGKSSIVSATYGGNCKAPIGNVTSKVIDKLGCNSVSSCSIPISNQTFGDPTPNCRKSFDIEYRCGSGRFTKNISRAEGQTMILDCDPYIQQHCQFYLILQDDGDVCIYKGSDPSNSKLKVWSSGTSGKQKDNNPDWVASKSKFGKNYLKLGETLASDEWISSTSGSIKMVMQLDGNLVLYTSEIKQGCKKVGEKVFGGPSINAVYKLDVQGNPATLGKIGYVDSDANLKEYPDSMVGFTNDYQIYLNTDSTGNYLLSMSSIDEKDCQNKCNGNNKCAGYVYDGSTKTCWLKDRGEIKKQASKTSVLGVRNPKLANSKTCSSKIINVDTIQYDNYVNGVNMTPDEECNTSLVSREEQMQFDKIKNELYILGENIATKMENLYNQNNKVYEKLDMYEAQFKKDMQKYKDLNIKIRKELELDSRNNIEGMRTLTDIDGMLSDSDLRVLYENYSYILWSILAVGILTITINTIKK